MFDRVLKTPRFCLLQSLIIAKEGFSGKRYHAAELFLRKIGHVVLIIKFSFKVDYRLPQLRF